MKEKILNAIHDTVSNFLFYDRKEDEELSSEAIEKAVESGEITVDEIVEEFERLLRKNLEGS